MGKSAQGFREKTSNPSITWLFGEGGEAFQQRYRVAKKKIKEIRNKDVVIRECGDDQSANSCGREKSFSRDTLQFVW